MVPGPTELAALAIFVVSYLGIAVGRVPWLALDRTGIAVIGAVAMLCTGLLSAERVAAALDLSTLAILGGLMLLSALYDVSGLYARITGFLTALERPRLLLVGTIVFVALLSALLTNDVVCVAVTPVIAAACVRRGWPAVPFLIAVAAAANIGSALTPIGNPQNILIAQRTSLAFAPFVQGAALPVLLSLLALMALLWRHIPNITTRASVPAVARERSPLKTEEQKALALSALAVGLFLAPIPPAIAALVTGALVVLNRTRETGELLRRVDFPLLLLFFALFVLVAGFEAAGWSELLEQAIRASGADLRASAMLVAAAAILSNLVSNVPAVMLLLPLAPQTPDHALTLALGSTLAGNAFLVSSVANLIVVSQAKAAGVELSFRDHARIGLPLTALSILVVLLFRMKG